MRSAREPRDPRRALSIRPRAADAIALPPRSYLPHPPNLTVPWDCAFVDVSCGRPKGENNKGSMDLWRREKLVFGAVAAIYKANADN